MPITDAKTPIVIRDITAIPELRAVEELQKEVWGIDDLEVFPALALIPMREVGAVLIGAFDGERMVGFVFGFPGNDGGRLILHSDMLAVRPEYRTQGLGYKLKLAQRERAQAIGIDTITWTFDPLQSLNAHLNISKLGVVADSYRVDYYGETTSFLHRAGTDRLWVTWVLSSERVHRRVEGGEPPPLNIEDSIRLVHVGEGQEPVIGGTYSDRKAVVIEIPGNINSLLAENSELTIRWRLATRQAFTELLAAGFTVEEFYVRETSTTRVGAYLLRLSQGSQSI